MDHVSTSSMLQHLAAAVALLSAQPTPARADENRGLGHEPLYAAPTTPDRAGRMLAAVEVNGSGPYRFIIDLGANRSVLSVALAAKLGIPHDETSNVEVHGVTGSAVVPLARVERLRIGEILLLDQQMPVLTDAVFAGADGILGVDGLQQARIEIDFRRDRVTIKPSHGRHAPTGYLTVPAQLMSRGLLLVLGQVGDIKTRVIIDTGAEYTIGNLRLEEELARNRKRTGQPPSVVFGATPGTLSGMTYATPSISIGKARLGNMPVTFIDLHVFSLWGLQSEPALIVGMDVLATLQKFVVDYGRREFQMKTNQPRAGAWLDRCQSGNCGTRLRPRP
jgi:predicted aspartyl protease